MNGNSNHFSFTDCVDCEREETKKTTPKQLRGLGTAERRRGRHGDFKGEFNFSGRARAKESEGLGWVKWKEKKAEGGWGVGGSRGRLHKQPGGREMNDITE